MDVPVVDWGGGANSVAGLVNGSDASRAPLLFRLEADGGGDVGAWRLLLATVGPGGGGTESRGGGWRGAVAHGGGKAGGLPEGALECASGVAEGDVVTVFACTARCCFRIAVLVRSAPSRLFAEVVGGGGAQLCGASSGARGGAYSMLAAIDGQRCAVHDSDREGACVKLLQFGEGAGVLDLPRDAAWPSLAGALSTLLPALGVAAPAAAASLEPLRERAGRAAEPGRGLECCPKGSDRPAQR